MGKPDAQADIRDAHATSDVDGFGSSSWPVSRAGCVPLAVLVLLAIGLSHACAGETTVVKVHDMPRQLMTYGMDFERLWYWDNLAQEEKQKLAKLALVECKVDYVRIALNLGAEAKEGKIDWDKGYGTIVDCMKTLQDARPDIKFFATPRPIQEEVKDAPFTCFPLWVTVFNGKRLDHFEWEKAADIMVRHLRYLQGKGFKIAYVDAKNECDKKVPAAEAAKMIQRMRKQLGGDMPLVIAPSSYDYQGAKDWLKDANAAAGTGFFDIVSAHNTAAGLPGGKVRGSVEELVALAGSWDKATWNTELHGWDGPDDKAAANTAVLLDQIRAGVSGINEWLSLGNQIKTHKMFRAVDHKLEVMRRYYIYRQLVNTSDGGRYMPVDLPPRVASGAAFLKGGQMTVWLLNSGDALAEVTVEIAPQEIIGKTIEKTWWGPDNGREGIREEFQQTTATTFTVSLPANSLHCFQFAVRGSAKPTSQPTATATTQPQPGPR